jgi:hypothetical protein
VLPDMVPGFADPAEPAHAQPVGSVALTGLSLVKV